MARSIVYIDGFNLYYGAIRGGPFKWLDLQAYFRRLRQADDIQRIYYFSALVDGPGRARQETYLRAGHAPHRQRCSREVQIQAGEVWRKRLR